jgi:hypothetical protein
MTDTPQAESLSFPQAIALTQSLMEQIEAGKLNEDEIERQVASILKDKNGGRGFFVSYLTSDMSLADNPSRGIVRGLKSSIELVSELLVKNLAMSTAMTITHGRNNDLDNAEGSQKVYRRTKNLLERLNCSENKEQLLKLQRTIKTGNGEYQNFLKRWNYDAEQQKAIEEAIADVLA